MQGRVTQAWRREDEREERRDGREEVEGRKGIGVREDEGRKINQKEQGDNEE